MSKLPQKNPPEPHSTILQQQAMLKVVSEHHPSRLNHFKRAYEGNSLRAAITAKCNECTSCDTAAIRECSGTACPLIPYRPYRPKTEGKEGCHE
ncbi:hypothetical protein [Pontiella desulfatans]|uniref:hypothetical protein n=1 Tax=Pontiella desulfatans TaxID=2750659 RepID=UPI00109D1A00|nr:hypothetical protein [Pontiella desulfatans]